jgi:hypothetical protein
MGADVGPLPTSPHLAGMEFLNVGGNELSKVVIEQLRRRFPAVAVESHGWA